MKYLKMIGLAAVAAMALMAFVGAGTASASVLCETATNPCTSPYGDITIEATLEKETSAILRDTTNTVVNTCTSSTVSGTLENGSSAATAKGKIQAKTGLIFTSCTNEPTTTVTGGELEIHATDDKGNGTVTAKGVTVTMPAFGGTCGFTASTGTDLGTYTESTKTIHIVAVVQRDPNHSTPFICPADAVWEANYVITKPTSTVFVSTS